MTTRPLPAVNGGGDDGRGDRSADLAPNDGSGQPGRGLRALELTAGLAGGGLLLLGVVLLLLQFVAPQLIDGADGPGWPAVLAHLLVGGAGEAGRGLRSRFPTWARALLAGLTVLAVLAVLVLFWWR
ncbi:hypothetical protein [Nakamurella lactea]|uniref:hypothetical protein n=1 Tax=Nakamurella lactea TaxID=459515 RepID=UPI0004246484|nr:hypothetical protein [Nakamurella lactea]